MRLILFAGDLLHKKWKNIRDRFARDLQERKGKTGEGARKKAPYMYARQLEFLRDTLTPQKTSNSLEGDKKEEDEEDDEEDDALIEKRPRISRVGKKKLHPIEEKILRSLDKCEKEKMTKTDDDDNRHFLLSLLPSLSSLPRHLNTRCRIEIMQCINKYETMISQHPQQPTTNLCQQYSNHCLSQQQQQQQQHLQFQPLRSETHFSYQQYQPTAIVPTPSPAESVASYVSSFIEESDS